MTSEPFAVSAIIPVHDDWDWLHACLDSLHAQTVKPEIVIVDMASKQDKREHFKADVWLRQTTDCGLAHGFNEGIRASHGQAVWLLTPDVRFGKLTLASLLSALDKADAVSPLMADYLTGTVRESGYRFIDPSLLPLKRWRGVEAEPVLITPGFELVRRDVLERIGLLDTELEMYNEEGDVSLRLAVAGYRHDVCPAAVVHHNNTSAGKARTNERKRFLVNRGRIVIVAKYATGLLWLALPWYVLQVLAEGLAVVLLSRSLRKAWAVSGRAILDAFRLRHHVRRERKRLAPLRKRSLWRWVRPGIGRWVEVANLFRFGVPKL